MGLRVEGELLDEDCYGTSLDSAGDEEVPVGMYPTQGDEECPWCDPSGVLSDL